MRDRFAIWLANLVLNAIARQETVRTIRFLIHRGMVAADEDRRRMLAVYN